MSASWARPLLPRDQVTVVVRDRTMCARVRHAGPNLFVCTAPFRYDRAFSYADEGRTWCRGWIDGPEADALVVAAALIGPEAP